MEFNIKTVTAVTDLGKLKGAAGGHRFICDDDNDYIVKFVDFNNKIAVNELIAGSLALELELPTPSKVLVHIPKEVIEDSPDLVTRQGQLAHLCSVLHIGSKGLPQQYEDFEKLSEERLQGMKLLNPEAMYGIVAFDNWLLNGDRNNNGNNMIGILPRNKMRYVAIDFSHGIVSESWSVAALTGAINSENSVPNFPFIENRLPNFSGFDKWIQNIEQFKDGRIEAILNSVPPEWKLDSNDKAILSGFIKARRNIVSKVISKRKR